MSRFRYLRDPLFLLAATGYTINRWLLKPSLPSPFLQGHFADILLIPAALPVVLAVQRRVGLRHHDQAPSWAEMLGHLTVWSIICEGLGPLWLHHGTPDPWDVAAYALGGIAACIGWNRRRAPLRMG